MKNYNLGVHFLRSFAWSIASIYATIPVFWLAVHPFAAAWRARRGKIYPLLGLIWLAQIILLLVLSAPWRHRLLYDTPWSWLAAVLFFVLGVRTYRAISKGFGRDRLIGRNELRPEEHAPELVTAGMHGRVRHPFYLAHWLMLTGWTVGSGLVVIYGFWIFALITGFIMLRAEERELVGRFGGEYRDYQQRVPMFFPSKFFPPRMSS